MAEQETSTTGVVSDKSETPELCFSEVDGAFFCMCRLISEIQIVALNAIDATDDKEREELCGAIESLAQHAHNKYDAATEAVRAMFLAHEAGRV